MYLSNNFAADNLFNFLLDERRISGKFDDNGRFKSIFGNLSFSENSDLKINLEGQNLLLNYHDIFLEFNYLDSYSFLNEGLKIYPKNFKSNFFALNEKKENSFDLDLRDF